MLADDHRIFAEGLRSLFEREFEVVAIAEDGLALLDAVHAHSPDLVVADVSMPGMNGIECVRRLRETVPEIHIVLLTMHDDAGLAATALRAGAAGYVLKHGGTRELMQAVEEALHGGVHVSSRIAEDVRCLLGTDPVAEEEALAPRVIVPATSMRSHSRTEELEAPTE